MQAISKLLRRPKTLIAGAIWLSLFGISVALLSFDRWLKEVGYRFQPWISNTALVTLCATVALGLLALVVLLGMGMKALVTDSHWVAQALATLPVLADVAVMLVAWFYLFLVSIFGLLGGVKIRDGDDTYLAEPMWLEPTFYCYRYEGIFFLRELGPAAPSCDAPREPSTDGGVAPADLTPQGNPGDSATEFENDNEEYCRSHAGDCFTSVWNGNLVRREDAQRYVDQLRDEVNAIEGSSFGWVEVDAALGSRLVYVVRQDEDGWSFVSEVPSIRGVEQAQLSDGVLQFENVDGQFTYNPDAETWNHTASTP